MTVVAVYSGSFCLAEQVIEELTPQFNQAIDDRMVMEKAADIYGVTLGKLQQTLQGGQSLFNALTHEKEKNIAYLKSVLAEILCEDNFIYHGQLFHLLPTDVSHILRVGMTGSAEFRVHNAMQRSGVSNREARNLIQSSDEEQEKWIQSQGGMSPWSKDLFDILFPMHQLKIEEAAKIIVDNLGKKVLLTTAASKAAVNDFALSAEIQRTLAEKGYHVSVSISGGEATVLLNSYVIRLDYTKEQIKNLMEPFNQIKSVEVKMGSRVGVPSRYDELAMMPRVLLVDDEKEYIQTLSERLQARDIAPQLAYDGEEAFNVVANQVPEVMVLDLQMPGIKGMDVLRKMKKEHPEVEVIILTGHGSENDKELAMELGAFAYLEKPVDIEVLSRTMKEAYEKLAGEK